LKKRKQSFLENENLSEDDEDYEIEDTWNPQQESHKSRKVSGMLFIILIILNKKMRNVQSILLLFHVIIFLYLKSIDVNNFLFVF
jgi:hypothetical protein